MSADSHGVLERRAAELDRREAELNRRAAELAAEMAADFERKLTARLKAELLSASVPADGQEPVALSQLGNALALDDSPAERHAEPSSADEQEEWDEMELEQSVWSNGLLCGALPGEGASTSALLMLLLVLNVAMQAIFCFIVHEALSTQVITEDTVVQYRVWRRNVAHDLKYYNAASQKSLAKRVCENDGGLEMSGEQASVANDLFQYLGEEDGRDMTSIGTLMASLALVCWSLSVAKELQAVMLASRAVCTVPLQHATRGVLRSDGGDSGGGTVLTFEAISPLRRAAVLLVYAARAALVLFLLIYGTFFLVYTIPLDDLLLNAVALEFVISIDEILYSTLVPTRVRRLVQGAAPLRVRARCTEGKGKGKGSTGGVDTSTLCTLVLTLAWVLGIYATVMSPQLDTLVRARDALCAGDQDFVFMVDGMGVPAWTYPGNLRSQFDNTTMPARNFPLGHNRPSHIPYTNLSYLPLMDRKQAGDVTYAQHVVDVLLQSYGRFTGENCKDFDATRTSCEYTPKGAYWKQTDPQRPACCLAQKTYANQLEAGRFSLRTRSMDDTSSANELWNPHCFDTLLPDGIAAQIVDLVRGAMGDAAPRGPCGGSCPAFMPFCKVSAAGNAECISAPTCADVAQFCKLNDLSGVRARQLCPDTCGCNKPQHPLALALPLSGCGRQCRKSGSYAQRLREQPCEDVPKNDTSFQAFLQDVKRISTSWPNDWRAIQVIAHDIQQFGCEYLSRTAELYTAGNVTYPAFVYGMNMCTETGKYFPIKPLSYFCPVACGCRAGDPHCPPSCPARNESNMSVSALCPEHMRKPAARLIANMLNKTEKYRCPQLNVDPAYP